MRPEGAQRRIRHRGAGAMAGRGKRRAQRAHDQAAHDAGVAETNLGLGGMDIDVDHFGRRLEEQRHHGMTVARQEILVGAAHGARQQLVAHRPADKLFTFLIQDTAGQGPVLRPGADKALDYLAGRTMGDMLMAEADATAATTVKAGRPTRVIRVAEVDERTIGALMMHFILETIFAAHLWKIDAFDQPAVEEGKVLTRQYLSARISSTGRRT